MLDDRETKPCEKCGQPFYVNKDAKNIELPYGTVTPEEQNRVCYDCYFPWLNEFLTHKKNLYHAMKKMGKKCD